MTTQLIPLELIQDNPYQPRTTDDPEHIEKLARSIAEDNLLQQPSARNHQAGGAYQLAFGHSRRKAFEWLKLNWKAQDLTDRYDGYTVMPLDIQELTDEQMYRHAVAENVQRKDLAPTELARSIKRYMDEFGANSQKAGELFGMNDATVRGLVRFLELPEPVQQKLDDGTITQGTARTLLTLQKLAPEKMVVKAVEDIEKSKNSRLPEEVIENIVRNKLDDTVTMHTGGDGKPRSSHRGGWPLDMKNFPNKYLPALTPVDAAIVLGIQDDEETMGRAARWIEEGGTQPDDGLSPELEKKLQHLVRPPACTACPFYARVQGSHFCGMKICHTRKTTAWHTHTIEQASKNLKIEIYQKSDGPYKLLDYGDVGLFEKRHKDLRLIPIDQVNGYVSQWNYKGVDDDVFAVLATGDAIAKVRSNKQTKGGKKTTAELVKMRQMKVYRPRRRELIWEFVLSAKSLLDGVPYPLLKTIHRWEYLMKDLEPSKEVMIADNAKVDAEKADYLRCIIVWKMAVEGSWHELNNVAKFADIVKRLEKLATEWGVKMPKKLTIMAEQFQTEVDAVAAETKKAKKK